MENYPIITNKDSLIVLPEGYTTNDADEKAFIDAVNDVEKMKLESTNPNAKGCRLVFDDYTMMLKAVYQIPHSFEIVTKMIMDKDLRERWRKGPYQEEKEISKEVKGDLTTELFLNITHLTFPMSNRDTVVQRKTWRNYQGDPKKLLVTMKSVNHPDYPEKSSPVRADIKSSGHYIEGISENMTKFILYNYSDMKLNTLGGTLVSAFPFKPNDFLENFSKECEKYKNSK